MKSLHRRLTLGLLAVFSLLIAAGSAALYIAVHAALLAQFDEGLRVKALVVITATEQRRGNLKVVFSDRFLREFDDEVGTEFFQVWSDDGESVERSDSLELDDLPQRFGSMESPEYWDMSLPKGGGAGRAIGIRFRPRMDRDRATRRDPEDAIVVVATPRGELDAILRQLGVKLALGGSGLLLATSLAVPLVLRPGLRPIRQVADRAQSMDVSSLGQPFPTEAMPSELQPICERLNDLLARLSASFERERRFSADLAHELLTPLAEIRAIAESALKWPETASASDYQRSVEITQRMEMLVTQVLELARAESGALRMEIVSIDLADMLRDISLSYKAAAEKRSIELILDGPDPLGVATDAGALRVIVGNLVSNAVAYAPEDSAVHVYWKTKDEAFEISTENPAPQIQAEDVPQLFNRFWRKDPARANTGHSGLGLAVASELATALGGQLTAERSSNGDLTFTLRLLMAGHAQLS